MIFNNFLFIYQIPSPRSVSSNEDQQEPKTMPKKSKESRLRELRQRTSDLCLPLITALFNDSSLQLSDRFMDQPPSKSRSMQHLTTQTSNHHHHHRHQHYYSNGNCSSGGCTSSSSSSSSASSTPSRASPASVERSCTFRVDEVIAKSALRQSNRNDANNNNNHHHQKHFDDGHFIGHRPISWHVEKSNAFINGVPIAHQNGWHHQYYNGSPNQHHLINQQHVQQSQQQPRRSSTGNSVTGIPKMVIQQPSSTQFYQLRS